MSDYNDPRPAEGTSAADPCAIYDNAVTFDNVLNELDTQVTYNGRELKTLPTILSDAQTRIDDYLESIPAVEEAPNDGKVYVRVNGAWVEFV